MKRTPAFLCTGLLLFLLAACSGTPTFVVEGEVAHADGKVLYFERFGLNATEVLDSAKLTASGRFHFKTPLEETPEFYRLRIDKRFIHLASDSARTVTVKADASLFGKDYTVSGSIPCMHIQLLSKLQGETLHRTDSIRKMFKDGLIDGTVYQETLFNLFAAHREKAKAVIYENPLSPAAYFALFQRFYNYLLFDPYDENDNKCYAAVATSWKVYFPEAERTKHLENLTLPAMKQIRQARKAKDIQVVETDLAGFFEINLPTITQKRVTLSSLKGRVILLDFTAYQSEFAPSRNLYFRELYDSFSDRGFAIYQVSFDQDEHFWKTSASNLPWTCVREAEGARSALFSTYNITQLPTYFLIDREGSLVARDAQVKDLYKEINALL
jgi:glutathione peroxidase-family protein